jgi:hypothetical protein
MLRTLLQQVPQQYLEEASASEQLTSTSASAVASADARSLKGFASPLLQLPAGHLDYSPSSPTGRRITASESSAALPSFLDLPESLDDVLLEVNFHKSSSNQDSNVTSQPLGPDTGKLYHNVLP